MPKLRYDECGKYTTPSGKKVVVLNITPEFYMRISDAATRKSLSRQAYIISAVNMTLEQDEKKKQNTQEKAVT